MWNWSWRWVTAAAVIVMLIAGITLYQNHQRQLAAQRSKEQLMLALRITSSKLRIVQERLSEIQHKTAELYSQQ
jgi:hypothetical protein